MIQAAQITDCGGRKRNEDTVRVIRKDDRLCAIVADGLGGHGGGEIASRAAADAVAEVFERKETGSRDFLEEAFEEADRAVRAAQSGECRMRTTAVVLKVGNGTACWGHVGDSRLYHFEEGHLVFQTMDHSVSQLAVLMGEIRPEQIRFHEDRSRVLRALGSESREAEFRDGISVEQGTHAFLLCTDGFWEYVYEREMEEELQRAASPQEWLSRMEEILLSRAEDEHDNYTAAAVFCSP